MKKSDMLLTSIGEIDDKFIEESEIKRKTVHWVRILAVAACICLVISAVTVLPQNFGVKEEHDALENSSDGSFGSIKGDEPTDSAPNCEDSDFSIESEESDEATTGGSSAGSTALTDDSVQTTFIEECDNVFIAEITSANRDKDVKEYSVSILEVIRSESDINGNTTVYDSIDEYQFEVSKTYLFSMNNSFEITDTLTSLVENDKLTPVYSTSKNVLKEIETVSELKSLK